MFTGTIRQDTLVGTAVIISTITVYVSRQN